MPENEKSPYLLIERVPTVQEYNAVREGAGLKPKDPVGAARGLAGSLFSVCVFALEPGVPNLLKPEVPNLLEPGVPGVIKPEGPPGPVIGIGRVVGDGGLWFDIVDVAVLPAHQGRGLGRQIMDSLMTYVQRSARPGSFIALMTQSKKVPFYEKYGFKARGKENPGMFQIMR